MKRKKSNIPIMCSIVCFVLLTGMCFGNGNEGPVRIPFEIYDNYILIKIRIDNSPPLVFGFDTGAEGTFIDSNSAKGLGFKSSADVAVIGASGSSRASVIRGKDVKIGHLEMKNLTFYGISLEKVGRGLGRRIDGFIGGDLLRNYPLKIDFDRKVIVVYSFVNFVYQGRGKAIDFRLGGNAMPLIPVELTLDGDEKITGVFGLDSGFSGAIMLNTQFVRRNRIASKVGKSVKLEYTGVSGMKSHSYSVRMKRIRVGTFDFRHVPAMLNQEDSGTLAGKTDAGIIGNSILRRFDVIIDFRRWKVYLEPNSFYYKDFKVNCSGLRLALDSSHTRVLVSGIIENSPAEKAGIKKRDEVVSLDGRPVKTMSLARIKESLMEEGRVVKITVLRRQVKQTFTLRLKKLI